VADRVAFCNQDQVGQHPRVAGGRDLHCALRATIGSH
jgi:hypothetical protein